MQKCAHLVELEKCCQTHIFLQNFFLIQPRTSLPKICKILLNLPILLTLTIVQIWQFGNTQAQRPQRRRPCRWRAARPPGCCRAGSRGRRSRGSSGPARNGVGRVTRHRPPTRLFSLYFLFFQSKSKSNSFFHGM